VLASTAFTTAALPKRNRLGVNLIHSAVGSQVHKQDAGKKQFCAKKQLPVRIEHMAV
jgi:hypothetical protein